jgi:hypothetical protein
MERKILTMSTRQDERESHLMCREGMYLSRLFRMARKILTLSTRRTSRGMITEKVNLMYCLYT